MSKHPNRARCLARWAAACTLAVVVPHACLYAQLPAARLDGIMPLAAAAGSTVELTIGGNDLDDVNQLLFSHAGIRAEQKMAEAGPFDEGPQPVANTFLVSVAADVPVGTYEVRCRGRYGLSNARSFVISQLPLFRETEPNSTRGEAHEISLPILVCGESAGGPDVDWYCFRASAGQRLLLDGSARRLDSRMDMVMAVQNAAGVILAENRVGQAGDPLIDLLIPEDGTYFIRVSDALYQQGTGYAYLLKIGSIPHVDFVMPAAIEAGTQAPLTVYGCNLPGGEATDLTIDGRPLQRASLMFSMPADIADQLQFSGRLDPHQGGLDGTELRVTAGGVDSNPVLISPAAAPVVFESAANDSPATAQKLDWPCEVNGQFFPQRDVDWFTFDAREGETIAISVVSQRLGLPTDPAILLQRIEATESGDPRLTDIIFLDDVPDTNTNRVAGRHEFDPRTSDPEYLFKAPADGTYRLLLKDGYSAVRSDPRLVYRLILRRPQPDFRVVAVPGDSTGSLMLRPGGRDVVRVTAYRIDGFEGEITVSAGGLPEGVTTEPVVIGPANTIGTLVLTAGDNAAPVLGSIDVAATADIDGQPVTRRSRYGAALVPFQFNQPNATVPSVPARLVPRIQLCIDRPEMAPALLTIGSGTALETSRGGMLRIPWQYRKQEGIGGNLIGFPVDLPPNTNAQQVNIGTSDSGEFEIRFQANTPPGTYTFLLAGFNQGMQYRRYPESLDAAVSRQERIAKIFEQSQQAVQQRQQEAQQLQNDLNQANAAVSQAMTRRTQAEQAGTAADNVVKQTEVALQQKQQQSEASPDDDALRQQLAESRTAHDTAVEKAREAAEAVADTRKQHEGAIAKQQETQDARTAAETALQAARQFQQQAQQEKQRADQTVNQTRNLTNPRGINVNMPSNSLTVRLVEFPITLESMTDVISVRQNEKVTAAVKLARHYEFSGNVNVQTQLPGGVGGIGIQNINIAEGQSEGTWEISAQQNAPVGEHRCTVRLQMNFNGQNLVMEHPMVLTVVENKPESQ